MVQPNQPPAEPDVIQNAQDVEHENDAEQPANNFAQGKLCFQISDLYSLLLIENFVLTLSCNLNGINWCCNNCCSLYVDDIWNPIDWERADELTWERVSVFKPVNYASINYGRSKACLICKKQECLICVTG